jgi:NAD(P)-dependent dehydrogenase (short-subunit alcohol dehydrogenase family)
MPNSIINLKNKVILITGGTGIQGPEHAKAFKKAGAKVIVTDIKEGDYYLDVTNQESIGKTINEIIKKQGKIDVLVNNAGATGKYIKTAAAPIINQSLKDWEYILKVNLTGVWLCSQKVGSVMAEKGGGSIINIASIYGLVAPDFKIYKEAEYETGKPMGTPAAYSASKGGVIALTKYLASYWADKGVRVNCVTPGGIYDKQSDGFVKAYLKRVPMGRMAKRNEISGALLYLASDLSSYVTGCNIVVDGGLTIR